MFQGKRADVLIALLVGLLSATGTAPAELEIHASLSGYNLLDPSGRCCAFDLTLTPDRWLALVLYGRNGERKTRVRLGEDQSESLRRVIQKADFFSLPEFIGPMPVDGDEYRITVRVGSRFRTVNLYNCRLEREPASLSKQRLEEARRACVVWRRIRSLVTDSEATVQ